MCLYVVHGVSGHSAWHHGILESLLVRTGEICVSKCIVARITCLETSNTANLTAFYKRIATFTAINDFNASVILLG